MIYVDAAEWKKSPTGRKSYAHMVADSLEELHEFAEQIGIKKHFFHKAKSGWHFDITSEQQIIAIQQGAKLVSSREILSKAKSLMPSELAALSEAIKNFR